MRTNASATIWRQSIDIDTRNVVYERQEVSDVHWFFRRGVSAGQDGLSAANSAIIRVPGVPVARIDVGDKIALGSIDEPSPPADSLTVVEVTKNAEGLHPHMKVVAK